MDTSPTEGEKAMPRRLVLTRHRGERIVLTTPAGDVITIENAGQNHYGAVRFAIVAAREVIIEREEISAEKGVRP